MLPEDTQLLFADILFPQNINRLTYSVPAGLAGRCRAGTVVEAPLRGRIKRGVIVAFHEEHAPSECDNKNMSEILNIVEGFAFPYPLLSLAQWVSNYYVSTEGLALKSLLFRNELETIDASAIPRAPLTAPAPEGVADADGRLGKVLDAARAGGFKAFLFHAGTVQSEIRFVTELLLRIRNVVLLFPEKYDAACFREGLEQIPGSSVLFHGGVRAREHQSSLRDLFGSRYSLVAGTMQTVFAPLENLSLIIVFREHSEFYKHEKTPMYNVRDVAVKRASLERIPVVLTSCAPSFESYHNCEIHKYTLLKDANELFRPKIRIVNAATGDSLITPPLRKAVRETLEAGKKSLIVLNRKGHSII
ncbi:MAG: primosomal protein N' family DNA-binding protein, partial [Thermodesulfovibrionales bacterium]